MSQQSGYSLCRPENLTLFYYGELAADERLRVEKHLQECAACRRELAQLRSTLDLLPNMEPDLSPGTVAAFNERVGRRLRPKRRQLQPVLGWSLAVTAGLLLVTLRSPLQEPKPSPPQVALHPGAEMERLPDPELLLNLEMLENLDLLQALEDTGVSG